MMCITAMVLLYLYDSIIHSGSAGHEVGTAQREPHHTIPLTTGTTMKSAVGNESERTRHTSP